MTRRPIARVFSLLVGVGAAGLPAAAPPAAMAQPGQQEVNPVYLDDSPTAAEALGRAPEHVASGNLDGAARVLQKILEEDGDRVVAAPGEKDLFVGVRARVHGLLLSDPNLLKKYRQLEEPRARTLLEEGDAPSVERSRLLTRAGFEAALRVAEDHLEGARFEAAWLILAQLERHPDRADAALGPKAAEALAAVASYLDRDGAWALADRWAVEASRPAPAHRVVPPPPLAAVRGRGVFEPGPDFGREGFPSKSLWTVPIGLGMPVRAGGVGGSTPPSGEKLPMYAQGLSILPTVAGDTLLVNDGQTIAAWDRFTLAPLWRLNPSIAPGDDAGAFDQGLPFGNGGLVGIGQARRGWPGGGGLGGGGLGGGAVGPGGFRQRQAGGGGPRGMQVLEDPSTITARGRMVVAVTGLAMNGLREGDGRVHAVDAPTGRARWSASIAGLDPQLVGTSVRGPALIADGAVVVGAHKGSPGGRLVSLYLVGLDPETGAMLWRRLVGSAGSLPFGRRASAIDAGTLAEGVVYRPDALGVIGAYEAATGRPLWVRRFDVRPTMSSDQFRPWEVDAPLIDGATLVVLSPDRREVLRLDRATGAVLGRRDTDSFGTPPARYLTRAGDDLVAVGDARIGLAPIGAFEHAPVRLSPRIGGEYGIRGRVLTLTGSAPTAAGAGTEGSGAAQAGAATLRLLVPTSSGLSILDPADLGADAGSIAMENPGNILTADAQLIVVDDARVHSYLLWDTAERVLTARLAARPADPGPAVTLAELAYRANKPERILGAVDAAVAAIESARRAELAGGAGAAPPPVPGAASAGEGARRRLVESLQGMITTSLEPVPPAGPPTAPATAPSPAPVPGAIANIPAPPMPKPVPPGLVAPAGRRTRTPPPALAEGAPAPALPAQAEVRIADPELLAALVARLGRVAYTADERVTHLFALGRLRDGAGKAAEAADTYAGVLLDPALAAATWTGGRSSLRADLEATWRLQRLVLEHGPAVYAVHEAQAARELAGLGADPAPEALETWVRRYPVAAAAPDVWGRLATAYANRGRPQAAAGALESGLRASGWRPDADAAMTGLLAGRLVRTLEVQGQIESAAAALRDVRTRHPALILTDAAGTIDADALLADLALRLAAQNRWARVGPLLVDGEHPAQFAAGWAVMKPMIRETEGRVSGCLVMESGDQVALWAPVRAGDAPGPDGAKTLLRKAWSAPTGEATVDLLRVDRDAAYLFYATRQGGLIEKVSARGPGGAGEGASLWKTPGFTTLFAADASPRAGGPPAPGGNKEDDSIPTPVDGAAQITDLLVAMDARTVALVERGGRAVAFDTETGKPLWAHRTPAARVYDVDLEGGRLVIGGDQEVTAPGGGGGGAGTVIGYAPVVVVLDARTGQVVQRLNPQGGPTRWIRLTRAGDLLVGLDNGIISLDIGRGQANWALSDWRLSSSADAWVVDDRLYVLASDRTMWTVGIRDGRISLSPLPVPAAFLDEYQPIALASVGPPGPDPAGRVAVSSMLGVAIVDAQGNLVGLDPFGGYDALIPPQPGDGVLVTIEAGPVSTNEDGASVHTLHELDGLTGRLLQSTPLTLRARPRRLALLDGVIAVTTGSSTIFYPAPVEK